MSMPPSLRTRAAVLRALALNAERPPVEMYASLQAAVDGELTRMADAPVQDLTMCDWTFSTLSPCVVVRFGERSEFLDSLHGGHVRAAAPGLLDSAACSEFASAHGLHRKVALLLDDVTGVAIFMADADPTRRAPNSFGARLHALAERVEGLKNSRGLRVFDGIEAALEFEVARLEAEGRGARRIVVGYGKDLHCHANGFVYAVVAGPGAAGWDEEASMASAVAEAHDLTVSIVPHRVSVLDPSPVTMGWFVFGS